MHMRKIMSLVEGSEYNIDKIRQIAEEFRDWMENHGYEEMRNKVAKAEYQKFEGMCNIASRKLAEIYNEHNIPARTTMMEYVGSDLDYWQQRGISLFQSEEEFEDAEPWERGESHEVVMIGNIIVDVTSDQFNPTNPTAHRVVVTKVGDRRYI